MKYLFLLFIGCFAIACSHQKTYQVEGEVKGADGKTLYFERAGVTQTQILDSVKLKGNGKFEFRQPAVSYPEFFRLRLNNQTITLAVDSTEKIHIEAPAARFATDYTVTGSVESEKIKTVTIEGLQLKQQLTALDQAYAAKKLSMPVFADSIQKVVTAYKQKVQPFIFENPRAATAYFTLFQRVNGLLIFDPYDKKDYSVYGAVATSWDTYYKESERAKQLIEITLDALRVHRQKNTPTADFGKIEEQNQIEIVLPDINGNNVKLSEMKGKVVLLDFTAYESDYSGPYNIALAKIYNKFKDKGFTIYQVSLDPNDHFWKVTASNLPWITVRDKDTIHSKYARSYNVTSLPTAYLLDREGNIVARANNVKDMETTISKLL